MKKILLSFRGFFPQERSRFFNLMLLSLFLVSWSFSAQTSGSPFVDAGEDILLECGETCTELTATYGGGIGETLNYEVESIDYTPVAPPVGSNLIDIPLTGGGIREDRWSNVINMPFDFCFYGNTFDKLIVGANAVVSFETNIPGQTAGQSCAWSISSRNTIPSPNLFKNAIFGPYMDIHPTNFNIQELSWDVIGTAPNRMMVFNFNNIPYFSCSNLRMTSQVVLYETSNIIEIYIEQRSSACSWNSGYAILGIQNSDGTRGYAPPGRNTGNWSATNEAWRFQPIGESTPEFAWLDQDGNVIGTDTTITVCPTEDVTTYTASATWTACNGEEVTLTDDVTVTRRDAFDIDLGGDQEFCGIDSYNITAEILDGNANDATFLWSTGETTQTITVTETGTYSVEVTLNTCVVEDSVHITLNESPNIDLGEDMNTCFEDPVILDATPSNYSDPSIFEFSWMRNGTLISGETSSTLTVTEPGRYSVTVSYLECEITDTINIGLISMELDLGEDFETCFADPVVLNANPNGDFPDTAIYAWTLDGSVIQGADGSSLTITENGTYGATVTVGSCSVSDSINVLQGDDPVVSLGANRVLCPGEKHTITATTDAQGAVFKWFRDGEEISGANGSSIEIDLVAGTATTTYSVEVSIGQCVGTDSVDISLYAVGSCIISQGISPNGDGLNDTLDLTFLNDRTGIKKLQIFNRLGTLVFEQNNYTNQWEGQTNSGEELPTGTYFYVIDLDGEDSVYGQQATGWIYLNRKP